MRDLIFISYRRDDTVGSSGRVYDWLRIAFGGEAVFRDLDSLRAGKWSDQLDAALDRTAAFVVVLGPRWASQEHLRRLAEDTDAVRREIAYALDNDIPIVPTLVEDATLPERRLLPDRIQSLVDWQALWLHQQSWVDDLKRLVSWLAARTGLPVLATFAEDVRRLSNAVAQIPGLVGDKREGQQQIEEVLADLTSKLADAGSGARRADLTDALDQFALGDTLNAEATYEREFAERMAGAADQAHRAAEAARNIARLARLRDTGKAIHFARQSLSIEPDDCATRCLLGDLLILVGDYVGARANYALARRLAKKGFDESAEVEATMGIAAICELRLDLGRALAVYEAAQRSIVEKYHRYGDAHWYRNWSVSNERIGSVLLALRDPERAMHHFCNALRACNSALLSSEAATGLLWRDLWVAYNLIGDALARSYRPTQPGLALMAYELGLDIVSTELAAQPDHPELKRDLSLSWAHIGGAKTQLQDLPGAIADLKACLAISFELANANPSNLRWQEDVCISQNLVGRVLLQAGQFQEAMHHLSQALSSGAALAERRPGDARLRKTWCGSAWLLAWGQLSTGDADRALASLRPLLPVANRLRTRFGLALPMHAHKLLACIHWRLEHEPKVHLHVRRCLALSRALFSANDTKSMIDLSDACAMMARVSTDSPTRRALVEEANSLFLRVLVADPKWGSDWRYKGLIGLRLSTDDPHGVYIGDLYFDPRGLDII